LEGGEKKKEAQVLASCGGEKSKNTREREGESSCLMDCSRREGKIMEGAGCLIGAEKQKKKSEERSLPTETE